MLKFDDLRIIQDHQVHGDDTSPSTFYVLPEHPRIARLENGGLSLRFVEYDALRVDGENKFGGFVAFDVDLAIPQERLDLIRQALDEELRQRFPDAEDPPRAVLAAIPWLGGSVSLLLEENGSIVERARGAATPSLAANNTACFLMELTQLGTAIFKETLKEGAASAVQVVYDLEYYARLPEMHALGTWHASEFYNFFQDVNTEDNFWSEDSYTELITSSRYRNEVEKTEFSFVQQPDIPAEQQAEFEESIRSMIRSQLNAAVERNLNEAIAEADEDVKGLREDQDIEDIRRTINKRRISDVRIEWKEAKAVIHEVHPQGQLPTVTSLTDAEGNPLVWEDYYTKISVDEFLKTVLVNVRVVADFDDLPLHSVEVKVRYPHGPNAKTVEKVLTSPEQVEKVEFLAHGGNRSYFHSHTVHFENSSFVLTSPEVEDSGDELIVGIDDIGILALDIVNGDIDFGQVSRANVRVRYDDGGTVVEKFVNLTETETEFKLREVIRGARTAPATYQVTYTMKTDGREITGPEQECDSRLIAVSDPFRSLRTVTFRAVGDLENAVRDIGVQASYVEASNDYRQTFEVTLSKALPFQTWTFPAIDETAGVLSYRATVNGTDGTSKDLAVENAVGTSFDVGEKFEDFLEVDIQPDLLDWARLKLVSVELEYRDEENDIHHREDFVVRQDSATQTWKVPIVDGSRTEYTVTATYFLSANGERKVVGPVTESAMSLFLEIPA